MMGRYLLYGLIILVAKTKFSDEFDFWLNRIIHFGIISDCKITLNINVLLLFFPLSSMLSKLFYGFKFIMQLQNAPCMPKRMFRNYSPNDNF